MGSDGVGFGGCVCGFMLDLARVAISSVHKGFEKHAYGFGLKERENGFKMHVLKDLLLAGQ